MILYKMMRQYKKWVFVWPVNFFFMLLCKWLCRYSPVFLKKWCHIQKSTKGRHCFNGKCLTKGSNPDFTNLSIFRQNLKVHHMFIIADCYKKPTWRKLSRVNQIWTLGYMIKGHTFLFVSTSKRDDFVCPIFMATVLNPTSWPVIARPFILLGGQQNFWINLNLIMLCIPLQHMWPQYTLIP